PASWLAGSSVPLEIIGPAGVSRPIAVQQRPVALRMVQWLLRRPSLYSEALQRQEPDLLSDHPAGLLPGRRRAGTVGGCADPRDVQRGLFLWRDRPADLQSVHDPAECSGHMDPGSLPEQPGSKESVRSGRPKVSRE